MVIMPSADIALFPPYMVTNDNYHLDYMMRDGWLFGYHYGQSLFTSMTLAHQKLMEVPLDLSLKRRVKRKFGGDDDYDDDDCNGCHGNEEEKRRDANLMAEMEQEGSFKKKMISRYEMSRDETRDDSKFYENLEKEIFERSKFDTSSNFEGFVYSPLQSVPRTATDQPTHPLASLNIPLPVLQATDQFFTSDDNTLEFYSDLNNKTNNNHHSNNNKNIYKNNHNNSNNDMIYFDQRVDKQQDIIRSDLLSQQLSSLQRQQRRRLAKSDISNEDSEIDDKMARHPAHHSLTEDQACAEDARNAGQSSSTSKRRRGTSNYLWEFLLEILGNPQYSPSLISWVDQSQGTFRLNNTKMVASLWGKCKGKPTMNYETMGRALRYYYTRGILNRVPGQRLVYQFVHLSSSSGHDPNSVSSSLVSSSSPSYSSCSSP